jgi:enamine deaminase RidA (YjgF/YER057c/UK114 family)
MERFSLKIARINPTEMPNAESIGYSQISVVEPGRMAYISGQVALPPDGGPVPAVLTDQMKVVAGNARAALHALRASPQDIVMARCLVTDLTPERLEEVILRCWSSLTARSPASPVSALPHWPPPNFR